MQHFYEKFSICQHYLLSKEQTLNFYSSHAKTERRISSFQLKKAHPHLHQALGSSQNSDKKKVAKTKGVH